MGERYCDCGLILMNPVSILDGRCMDCRGEGIEGWYEEELRRRARLKACHQMLKAERYNALVCRVYGGKGRATESLSGAEAKGRGVAAC